MLYQKQFNVTIVPQNLIFIAAACDPSPCSHGTCTVAAYSYEYSCNCEDGYEGHTCGIGRSSAHPYYMILLAISGDLSLTPIENLLRSLFLISLVSHQGGHFFLIRTRFNCHLSPHFLQDSQQTVSYSLATYMHQKLRGYNINLWIQSFYLFHWELGLINEEGVHWVDGLHL